MAATVAGFAYSDSGGVIVESFDLTKPSGVGAGDLLILIVDCFDSGAVNKEWRTLDGWLNVAMGDKSASQMGVFYRIADGTEGATESVRIRNGGFDRRYHGYYLRVTGARATQPLHMIAGPWSNGGVVVTTVTINEVQTEVDDCLVLGCLTAANSSAVFSINSGPGWSITDQQQDADAVMFAEKVVPAAGLSGDLVIDLGVSASFAGAQIAILPAAADPSFYASVASSTKANGGAGFVDELVIDTPAGVEVGDLLVVFFFVNGNHIYETPVGWTLEAQTAFNTSQPAVASYWKIADGTEGATLTLTTSGFGSQKAAWYWRITDHDAAAPVVGASFGSTTQTNPLVTNETQANRLPTVGVAPVASYPVDKFVIWGAALKNGVGADPWTMDDGGGYFTVEDSVDIGTFFSFEMAAVVGFGQWHTGGHTGDLWCYPDGVIPPSLRTGMLFVINSGVEPPPPPVLDIGGCPRTLGYSDLPNDIQGGPDGTLENDIDGTLAAVDPGHTLEHC